ncbi:MAG: MOSC domain-containing protein [Candidatus Binatia bacterium]
MEPATVAEIWRHPVKSMMGERVAVAELTSVGIVGDRAWAVRDEAKAAIRGAKKIPGLMNLAARYPEPPTGERAGPAEIELPDGERVLSDSPDAAAKLGKALGLDVTLWPLQPADKLDHYRRGAPDHEDLETELRSIFALEPDEPLPDLSGLPPDVLEFESPPGTYFDAYPLLVMTDASLSELARLAPQSKIDVRRFRPNLLLATGETGVVERDWVGQKLRIGEATIEIKSDCPRCVMTTLPFADLPKDPSIMRTLVREAGQVLGVYAVVVEPGAIREGDAVELLG